MSFGLGHLKFTESCFDQSHKYMTVQPNNPNIQI